ncbi:extradiol ring-cleavage dioxygenase [Hesseltinella vesiculosa]|uniref:Extradiol ring-cleavage dioxygenase n=1 Tax=Hesseltinella vesiculosa TaxID=101127 RepID=A0A1X2GS39_9FUNG|nr:extradiol ring-cleavage dioxygenase [Hesseltinella vesiculosa]
MAIQRQPAFFISHGGPNLLEDNGKPGSFYTSFGNLLKNTLKPKAIVIVSAHWQGQGRNGIFVETSAKPELIYDFYGFPKHYYEETWDNRGDPQVATHVIDLLNKAGIHAEGQKRGIDHGVWVPLKRAMKSVADIPIVAISTFDHEDMVMHVKLGKALAHLRDENIVVIGSGTSVHNLRELFSSMGKPSPSFVNRFESSLDNIALKHVGEERNQLSETLAKHPDFRRAHPTAEHLMPFHIALGAAQDDKAVKILDDAMSTIAWGTYAFGLPDNEYIKPIKHSEL